MRLDEQDGMTEKLSTRSCRRVTFLAARARTAMMRAGGSGASLRHRLPRYFRCNGLVNSVPSRVLRESCNNDEAARHLHKAKMS